MTWVAVAVAGGAVLGAGGSMMAADKQAGAAGNAAGMSQANFNMTVRDMHPFTETGQRAQIALGSQLGLGPWGSFDPNAPLVRSFGMQDFQQDPGYQFRMQQGQQAIDKGANARGNYYAPQTLQDLSKFSQGMASDEFNQAYKRYNMNQQNVYGRLTDTANRGAQSVTQQGNFGQNNAQYGGNAMMQGADAQAAGIVGATNNIGGGIGDLLNMYLQNQKIKSAPNNQSFVNPNPSWAG